MIKIMVGLLIIACIAPLFIKGPDGEPIMTLDDWKIEVPDQIKDLVKGLSRGTKKSLPDEGKESLQVYKWQDDEGQWHFSNAPPNLDVAEEVLIGDVNLMQAYAPPEAPATSAEPAGGGLLDNVTPGIPQPGQIEEMMETVDQFQQTMEQRKEALDTLSGN